jgi:hypothetical protein
MDDNRFEQALARMEAALARIAAARLAHDNAPVASARVIELVNKHEKLREEVAETMRDLDSLIERLEG